MDNQDASKQNSKDDNFKKDFIKSVQQPGASIQPESSFQNKLSQKKINLPIILVFIEAIMIIILAIMNFSPLQRKEASIADDESEDVRLGQSGRVEAISAFCDIGESTIYFSDDNNYRIMVDVSDEDQESPDTEEIEDVETVNSEDNDEDEDVEIATFVNTESGVYLVDGLKLHLLPDEGEDFYADYSSHKLTYKGNQYDCENYKTE